MTQLPVHICPGKRKLLGFAAPSPVVISFLASLPFLLHLPNRGLDWITGLRAHFRPGEEPLWLR
jgi:hypothetical protein